MKIRIQELTQQYGETKALDALDLEVGEGTGVLVVIGPSGGGKSTLLRLLGGLETPDSGVIEIDGTALPETEVGLLMHRRQHGYLFQSFNLFPHLTALENVTLPLIQIDRNDKVTAEKKALHHLDRFGLSDHARKYPAELSGGQQQRVALSRALANEPGLLLLDEPTSALDPETSGEVLDVIAELGAEGQQIVLSTHEMGFAKAVADEVAFLAAGKIVEQNEAGALFEDPKSEELQRFLARVMRY